MVSKKWLNVGRKIEMEHVDKRWPVQKQRAFATKIATDHLKEYSNYYSVLPGAERQMAAMLRKKKR